MIGKHLWPKSEHLWRAKETRTCMKCRSRVTYVTQPRGMSRIFKTVKPGGIAVYGSMTRCEV